MKKILKVLIVTTGLLTMVSAFAGGGHGALCMLYPNMPGCTR